MWHVEGPSDLIRAHPVNREYYMTGPMFHALGRLATTLRVILGINLESSNLPDARRKKGGALPAAMWKLNQDLQEIRGDFVANHAPLSTMADANNQQTADAAGQSLDTFVTGQKGKTIGGLFEDIINDCLSQVRARIGSPAAAIPDPNAPQAQENEDRDSTEDSSPPITTPISPKEPKKPEPIVTSPSTLTTMKTLFKDSNANTITWAAFVTAMKGIGFQIQLEDCGVITFNPDDQEMYEDLFTVQRPHQDGIEGAQSILLSERLKEVFKWDERVFVEE